MADITIHVLKPSVNNLTARIFVRAAGLDFEEVDAWGKTTSPEFMKMNPAHLTPTIEEAGLPKGALWESCAIMQYLCNKHGLTRFYPADPAERAMIDSAMCYLLATSTRCWRVRPTRRSASRSTRARSAASDADAETKAEAQRAAEAALAEPLEVYRTFFMDGKHVHRRLRASIADMRLAASLEFLRAIDYDFPEWLSDYMTAMEEALGDAYTEPAGDVRGYIAHAKSQVA